MAGKAIRSTFDAWINKMPPSRDTLHVKGKVEFPTPGYKAELVEAVPPGINREILILDVRETPPTGPVNQVVTQVDAAPFSRHDSGHITEVTIRSDAPAFTLPVRVVR